MTFSAEGRLSDSPYIDSIWRGQAYDDTHVMMCPADGRLNIGIAKLNRRVKVTIEGPITQATPVTHIDGAEWLVIKFHLGVCLPCIPAKHLLDDKAVLSDGRRTSFSLSGFVWPCFDFENAEVFVARLVREELLFANPVVISSLKDEPQTLSPRTVRDHFVRTTGLTQSHIRQIEKARAAMTLLQQDVPILDVVYEMGYADQAHLTRAMKRFMGYTPAQTPKFGPYL
jgi:AraC-like DNA-binding protein